MNPHPPTHEERATKAIESCNWTRLPASVTTQVFLDELHEAVTTALREVEVETRARAIEECAKVAEDMATRPSAVPYKHNTKQHRINCNYVAHDIRSLADQLEGGA